MPRHMYVECEHVSVSQLYVQSTYNIPNFFFDSICLLLLCQYTK
jgi:hypothetical protein